MSTGNENERLYLVVRNDEQQYSVWFADRDIPAGWYDVGRPPERKAACLEYIDAVWTDMRPASARDT